MDQAPLSMGFSRQEHRSGLLFPFPGDLPDSGIEPGSAALQADSLPAELPGNSFYLSLFFPKGKDGAYISEVVAQGDEEHEGTQQRPAPSLFQGLPHFRQILYQLSYQGSL